MQEQLNTRAIEIATMALANINRHEIECRETYKELMEAVRKGHEESMTGRDRLYQRIEKSDEKISGIMLKVGIGIVTGLCVMVWYLITHHGL